MSLKSKQGKATVETRCLALFTMYLFELCIPLNNLRMYEIFTYNK